MRKSKFAALLASTSPLAMSPAERVAGRLMRSPDEHAAAPAPSPTPAPAAGEESDGAKPNEDFAAFEARVNAGDEGDKSDDDDGADEGNDGEDGDDGDGEAEAGGDSEETGKPAKGKKPAGEYIKELRSQLAQERRDRATDRAGFEARLERIEKGLPAKETDDTKADEKVAPDPNDAEKYPLGVLDDRYIEDKLEFLADKKAEERLGSLLQREQEKDQQAESERLVADLKSKAETMASKGASIHSDYHDVVVAPAMAGEFDLTQDTFEALAEAEHGAQILYDLAQDKAEAARVAQLSPYQRLKFVLDKDAEYKGKTPAARKIPGAEQPPAPNVRGAGKSGSVSPDTTNFADFERMANSKK